ncbi:MAG: amidase family protein [Actinomycetota bacterium]
MEAFADYQQYDAVGLAELVASRQVHPGELVEAAIERIENTNETINAVIRTDFDRARQRATDVEPRGPFGGVPFLIKELLPLEGEKATFASVLFRDFVAELPSVLGDRIDAAGFISLGRTNSSEFGLLPTTEPVLHGPTHNPWDLSRSPGGSSGGSAAAVASGMVPLAHGSDGGGSIRIPASNCGLFGLKPTRGRMPMAHQIAVDLGVSRSVRDSAALLEALHGSHPGDQYWAPNAGADFAAAATEDPSPLRIAYSVHDFRGEPVDPQVSAAIIDTAHLLESLGHTVVEARPAIDGEKMGWAFVDVWAALVADMMKIILEVASEQFPVPYLRSLLGDYRTMRFIGKMDSRKSGLPALEGFTWSLADYSLKRDPGDLRASERTLGEVTYSMASFLEEYDMLLTPVLAQPPVMTGHFDQSKGLADLMDELLDYVAFTPVANFTGLPAMSVPLSWTDAGLPVGSHFFGRFGDEETLLKLAGQLERAQPWANRRPD